MRVDSVLICAQPALLRIRTSYPQDNGGPTTTGDGVGARNWPLKYVAVGPVHSTLAATLLPHVLGVMPHIFC